MRVIDCDSHFLEPVDWIEQADPDLATQVPKTMTQAQFTEVVFAEFLAAIPEDQRPSYRELLSPGMRRRLAMSFGDDEQTEVLLSKIQKDTAADRPLAAFKPKGAHDAAERLEFCDAHGIDVQLISPTVALGMVVKVGREQPHLRLRVIEAYNTWAARTVAGHTDRLIPVTYLDFADVSWAVRELTRMREAGSRAFLFPLDPSGGRSLADPALDPVWAAAVDLGMIAFMHVGYGRVTVDPGWAKVGDRFDATILARLVMTQTQTIPQMALATMIYGGVFDRHPGLTVVCQEFGLSWVEGWIDRIGPATRAGRPTGVAVFGWNLKRTPEEYLRHNIRFSPLQGQRVDELVEAIGPEVAVFATDYPHPEGSASAAKQFGAQLAAPRFDDDTRARFFGGTMEELLARGA